MKRSLLLLLLLTACDRHASTAAANASAASTAAPRPSPAPAPAPSGITPFPADSAEPPALEQGPVADSAPASEREQRLVDLLRGQTPAEALPLAHTDANTTFDPDQFDNLTTKVEYGTKLLGRRGSAGVSEHRLLSGNLDGQPVPRVLAGMRPVFRSCYDKALQLTPRLQGPMVLRFEVAKSGAMHRVTVVSAPPSTAELKRCVVARAQAASLEPLTQGETASFEVTVTFVIEGGP